MGLDQVCSASVPQKAENAVRSLIYVQSISQASARAGEHYPRPLILRRLHSPRRERLIKQRDALLESHGLESRKLADILDKERQAPPYHETPIRDVPENAATH